MITEGRVVDADLFQWLVEYHILDNWEQECRQLFRDGQVYDRKGLPPIEGSDKGTPHEGILIFRNGNTLLEELVQDERVNPRDLDNPLPLRDKTDLFSHLRDTNDEDGVYVLESAKEEMRRVIYIKPGDSVPIAQSVPLNFVNKDGCEPEELQLRVGTKTRLAVDITACYTVDGLNVRAYQIKRSRIGKLGLGKVTEITSEGLRREFFLEYAPDHKGPFVDEENKIIGVCREYARNDGRLEQVAERYVHLENGQPQYTSTTERGQQSAAPQNGYVLREEQPAVRAA